MCGIAGFVGRKEKSVSGSVLESMAEAMFHRGPDDGGFWGIGCDGNKSKWKNPGEKSGELRLGFAFRRLAILDLSPQGAQPMTTPDDQNALVVNGEIYNYPELKKTLPSYSGLSSGDTEVLLQGLTTRGISWLNDLQGMFAFAFYDGKTKKTHLVRDPTGIKPLYYFEDERGLFFASEIRALLKAQKGKPRLRHSHFARYLMNNWIMGAETLFDGIQKLEPGCRLEIDDKGEVNKVTYWNFNFTPDESLSSFDWEKALSDTLERVVSRQMRSDVPLGFFLSGGVDSSLLVAKAALTRKKVSTFTTGFRFSGSESEDIQCARELRDHLSLDYSELILEPSIVNLLPKVVASLEEPLSDPAALTSYLLCEAAATKFRVLISGQGADELFGGYPVYQAGLVAGGLGKLPSSIKQVATGLSDLVPYSVAGREVQSVHRLRKITRAAKAEWPESFSLLRGPFSSEGLFDCLRPEVFEAQVPPFGSQWEVFQTAENWDRISQMLYLDSKSYLPALNLTYGDKTSMAHSIELRVPYLDQELVSLIEKIPSRFKVRLDESKPLLKQTAEKMLPLHLVRRKKMGFGLPLRQWFRKDLQPLARDLLSPERLNRQGLLNSAPIESWLNEHESGSADHCMKLYSLMTFQLWCDTFDVGI